MGLVMVPTYRCDSPILIVGSLHVASSSYRPRTSEARGWVKTYSWLSSVLDGDRIICGWVCIVLCPRDASCKRGRGAAIERRGWGEPSQAKTRPILQWVESNGLKAYKYVVGFGVGIIFSSYTMAFQGIE